MYLKFSTQRSATQRSEYATQRDIQCRTESSTYRWDGDFKLRLPTLAGENTRRARLHCLSYYTRAQHVAEMGDRPLSRRIWPPPPNFVRFPKIIRKKFGQADDGVSEKKSSPSSLMPFWWVWWPLAHKVIVLYSVDLTNNNFKATACVCDTNCMFAHL